LIVSHTDNKHSRRQLKDILKKKKKKKNQQQHQQNQPFGLSAGLAKSGTQSDRQCAGQPGARAGQAHFPGDIKA
jgi:hypothetical protein